MGFHSLASLREHPTQSHEVQTAIKEWYEFFNNQFTRYSFEEFSRLIPLYIQDERLTTNISGLCFIHERNDESLCYSKEKRSHRLTSESIKMKIIFDERD